MVDPRHQVITNATFQNGLWTTNPASGIGAGSSHPGPLIGFTPNGEPVYGRALSNAPQNPPYVPPTASPPSSSGSGAGATTWDDVYRALWNRNPYNAGKPYPGVGQAPAPATGSASPGANGNLPGYGISQQLSGFGIPGFETNQMIGGGSWAGTTWNPPGWQGAPSQVPIPQPGPAPAPTPTPTSAPSWNDVYRVLRERNPANESGAGATTWHDVYRVLWERNPANAGKVFPTSVTQRIAQRDGRVRPLMEGGGGDVDGGVGGPDSGGDDGGGGDTGIGIDGSGNTGSTVDSGDSSGGGSGNNGGDGSSGTGNNQTANTATSITSPDGTVLPGLNIRPAIPYNTTAYMQAYNNNPAPYPNIHFQTGASMQGIQPAYPGFNWASPQALAQLGGYGLPGGWTSMLGFTPGGGTK